MPVQAHHNVLVDHLAWWGLRQFTSDRDYFQWQRETISPVDLARLTELAQRKSINSGDVAAEIAFYDFSVRPGILAALYSQRYDYYLTVGPLVVDRLGEARMVLDFGCGPGILTTFYAQRCPDREFLGIDRSEASVAAARARAEQLGLNNVQFERGDMDEAAALDQCKPFDVIIATHALLQSEHDLGIPSKDWRTFARSVDPPAQADFERRTGLGPRLDHLCTALAPHGRLLVFEKTRQLARRIPFQRAFAERGYCLLESPLPVCYSVVEEVTEDGPFYAIGRATLGEARDIEWDESAEFDDRVTVDLDCLRGTTVTVGKPLYENHTASAHLVWAGLPDRRITKETTRDGPNGRQLHVEIGQTDGLSYLFCANTFDQRQLVIAKPEQAEMLEEYYQEIVQSVEDRMMG